jgi:phospholipid transport system substrate-binding protein
MHMPMPTRRTLLTASLATALALALGGPPGRARAQSAELATGFVEQAGKDLTAVINAPGPIAGKQAKMQDIVDRVIDVDSVARFCLGRFWRTASAEQQLQYLALFHQVLMKNITGKLGEFQGVTFVVGRTVARDGEFSVATVVTRPGSAPANVEWVVSTASGAPRIIDVVAEGTSLRLTQRSDYASYIARNGNSVQALLDAMRQQLTQSG